MNLIYLRHTTPKTKKFIKAKLRRSEPVSVYDIAAGDCCLAPAPVKRRDYIVTFLNDISPEMLAFMYTSQDWTGQSRN
ncbi:MAG: hypothetical protein A2X32_04605 [Elusimicrobia bacterium GWC2_64_44]|nr:MAG: hypothetical protein A2X32_04605 [Elusimicrobia bacterium GWC2_64_44]